MSAPGGFSYRPNVNRAVTKKWKEASQVSYGGDDWGDEDDYGYEEPAPVSAGNQRHPGWQGQGQGQVYPSNRSVTNPSPSRSAGRSSFDRGDERRNFSTSGASFESAYPTAQRNPFPDIEHDYEQQPQYPRHAPPLSLHTQSQGPYPAPGFRPSSRGQQQRSYAEGPFSAPGAYPHSRSESGSRTGPPDLYQRRESPIRPDSRSSNASGRHFPPRKSSLSQTQPPADFPVMSAASVDAAQNAPSSEEVAPPPFIRPADIYKRIEEERQKERLSQESSRPSIDLNHPKTRDSSTSARSAASEIKEPMSAPTEDSDSMRRLKPTLDTVVERKSEYGFDSMLSAAGPDHSSAQPENASRSPTSDGVHRQVTNASSVYTDRPDPVSASSVSRNQSLREYPEAGEPTSSSSRYALPSIDRMSSFGTDLTSLMPSDVQNEKPTPTISAPGDAAPAVPAKDSHNDHVEAEVQDLGHQTSVGYRSVVHQAFDESQNQNPLSPVSGSNTIPRSNSASTSDISPIMSRRTEQVPGTSGPFVAEETIPEEPTSAVDHPVSTPTASSGSVAKQEQPLPAPPGIQVGYRRDVTPPDRENSPAKRPLSVETVSGFKSQRAMIAPPAHQSVNANVSSNEDNQRGRLGKSAAPGSAPHSGIEGSLAASPLDARTTSEEYEDWRNERKQFNNKFGFQDSNPTTPGAPSPVSRAESPPKGTVRDIKERLESHSGRSTPVSETTEERPTPQQRLDSFRPSIPGGWQSFTGTPGVGTPSKENTDPLKPPTLLSSHRHESSDSIPTAKAPTTWAQSRAGPSTQAFAAAAAAGTALAGAFSGSAFTDNTADEFQDSSDDEWNRSPVSQSPQHHASDTRDFAVPQPDDHLAPLAEVRDSKPPTPLPKDTPVGEHTPSVYPESTQEVTLADAGTSNVDDYFPAPLRTSRSIDPKLVVRPPIPDATSVGESVDARNNDQLQQEIVKSLTPKSSNFEGQPEYLAAAKTSSGDRDDLYGSGPSSPTPHAGLSAVHTTDSAHQAQPSISTVSTGSPERPLFAHRFSWEADVVPPAVAPKTPPTAKSPATQSPDTIRGPSRQVSNVIATPVESPRPQTSGGFQKPVINLTSPVTSNNSSSPDAASLRKIMNIGNHQARMDAYAKNRDLYAQSDGMLDRWIMSMRESTEHADMFSGRPMPNAAAAHKSSPSRPMPNIGGGKLMPEDGKRLMAAAGRFGGKAGGAAKGLFAKGKEKLRQASAGDKGIKANRRKSAGPSLLEPEETRVTNRNSALLTTPPQIAAQDFSSSPIDAGDWSLREVDENPVNSVQTKSANDTRSIVPLSVQSTNENRRAADPEQKGADLNGTAVSPLYPAQATPISQLFTSNGTAPAPAAAAPPVTEPSSLPESRSIQGPPSQLGLDVSAAAEREDGYGQVGSYMPPSQRASRTVSNLQQPELPLQPEDGASAPEHTTQGPSAVPEQGLMVPDEARPRSLVSDVSSASPSPAKDREGPNLERSVSPAEEHEPPEERSPAYDDRVSSLSKEQEAKGDRAADETLNDPVPSYDEQDFGQSEFRQPRIGPGAQIVPVADLSRHKRMGVNRSSARPFSFDGSEILKQAQQSSNVESSHHLHNVPSQPLSPIGQTLSKSISQVSAEEVHDMHDGVAKKQSRSYSRPFGADLVAEHPALQQPTESVDRSQMYSTESPLPSARRPQPDPGRPMVQSPPLIEAPEEEEGYRIPGPYRQEYRSPRQNSTPHPQVPTQPTNHAAADQYQQEKPLAYPKNRWEQPSTTTQQSMGPPPTLEGRPMKKGGFGGFFGHRSGSRSRRGRQGEQDTNQRNVLRRQDSLASQQSSSNEARDVVGRLPSSDKKQRRFSRDFMRTGTPVSTEPGDSKKKRFSGMGFFSRGSRGEKSAPPQRSSTLPNNSNQPGKYKNLPPDHQQRHRDPAGDARAQFEGFPPPVGGYYAPQDEHSHYWDPHVQIHPQGQAQTPYQQRPVDLRIDTSSGGRSPQSVPASAPPQTRTTRDISYQSRPYVPPNARPPSADPPNIPRGPSPHVVELHKRSRSPKLGRQSEDEEQAAKDPATDSLGTPVEGLGTFSKKKISPVGGVPRPDEDQEAPFRIALPGESSEDKRRTRQLMIEQGSIKDKNRAGANGNILAQTVAERMTGPQQRDRDIPGTTAAARAPMQGSASGKGAEFVAELPGSKAEGYESEEDVQMSATAYPGQWQDPIYFDGGRWED